MRLPRWPAATPGRNRSLGYRASALLLLLLLVLAGRLCCSVEVQRPPPLTVELDGCDVVRAPPHNDGGKLACVLPAPPGPRRLHLWIDHAPWVSAKLWLDDKAVEGQRASPLPGAPGFEGDLVDLDVFEGARELRVTTEAGGKSSEVRLPLFTEEPSQDRDRLAQAVRLRREDHLEEAERILEKLSASADPGLRAKAMRQRARIARSRAPGGGLDLLYVSRAMDEEAGNLSDELDDGLMLAFVLLNDEHDLDAAEKALDRVTPLLAQVPRGRALASYYRALLASERADVGTELELLDESARLSRRLTLVRNLSDVYQEKLLVLALLGGPRPAELNELRLWLDDPRLAPTSPCVRAQRDNNLAWGALVTPGSVGEDVGVLLKEAVKLYDGGGCSSPHALRNALTNLARWAIETGRYPDAARYLEQARAQQKETRARDAVDWELLSGELHLRSEHADEALWHFEQAAQRSREVGLLRQEVLARFGAAEALEDLGQVEDAIESYTAADAQLDRWSVLVPFGQGKQTFFDEYERPVRRYLHLLVEQALRASDPGAVRAAACVARRSRARVRALAEWQHLLAVAPLEKRANLDRALERVAGDVGSEQAATTLDQAVAEIAGAPSVCDEPAADEVLLIYHPLPAGYAGFAVSRTTAVVKVLDAIGSAQVKQWQTSVAGAAGQAASNALLRPFSSILDDQAVQRVRFLPAGPLGGVELHRLPWRDGNVTRRFSVTYGVDALRPPAPTARGRSALVVSISGGAWDRYQTGPEADAVRDALRKAGWDHVFVLRDDEATPEEVRRILEREDVELFHYAGHSIREGVDAWDSYLTLGRGQRWTIADALGLRHAPRWVVLSSCVTDAGPGGVFVAGMGIAPAFVIAGAEVAVATAGTPNGSLIKDVMSQLYGAHLGDLLDNPAAALRATASDLRRSGDLATVELPSLRVLVK